MVGFPLLLIPLAIYNIIAWLMPDVPLSGPLIRLTLVSRVEWQITLSDILLSLGVLLLLLEIMKGARPGSKYLTDHLLSLIVFGGSAAEFVMLPKFGTSTFFLLSLMAMVDFVGGIALHARRRAAPMPASRRVPEPVEPAAPEPERRVEPVPAAHSPSAATVAEPVLPDHSRAKPDPDKPDLDKTASDKLAAERSPTVPSPDLQPGTGAGAPPEDPR